MVVASYMVREVLHPIFGCQCDTMFDLWTPIECVICCEPSRDVHC